MAPARVEQERDLEGWIEHGTPTREEQVPPNAETLSACSQLQLCPLPG